MNIRHIYLAIKSWLEDSGISDISSSNIFSENEAIQRSDFYIEIKISVLREGFNKTESDTVTPVMAHVCLCIPVNQNGNGYISHKSHEVASRFSEQNPGKWAFVIPAGIFYVRGLNQIPGYIDNDLYKQDIQVRLDVYESRL